MRWQLIRQDGLPLPIAIRRGITAHEGRIGTTPTTILCHHDRVKEFAAATELEVRGSVGVQPHEFLVGQEERDDAADG